MTYPGPVGGRSGQAYKKKKKKDPSKDIIKQGHTSLRKLKGGKVSTVKYPTYRPPAARYGPRKQEVGGDGEGKEGEGKGTPKVGAGPGEPGEVIGREGKEPGEGKEAGEDFENPVYRELKKKELINWMQNELELELIKKGGLLKFEGWKFPAITDHGPESLLRLEDTVRAMYQRQIVESEDFDGDIKAYFTYKDRKPKELSMDELMIFLNDEEDDLSSLLVFKNDEPIPAYSLRLGLLGFDMGNLKEKDLRYLMPIPRYKVDKDAVIIFNRDVSGSISQEEMEMSYTLTLLIEIWLEEAYDDIRSVYIAHNGDAWEESEEGYYNLESGGGTAFEPSYDIPLAMIEHRDYNRQPDVEKKILRPDETDIYMVQMTDGENWDPEPSILKLKEVMPYLTRMCYLETNFGWGAQANQKQKQHPWAGLFGNAAPGKKSKYWQYLEKNFESEMEAQKLRMTGISEVEGVWDAMRVFFGKKGGK